MHQAVLCLVHAAGEGHVLSGLIEERFGVGRKSVNQIGLSGKLVREFFLRRHGSAMLSRRLGESFIFLQRRKAGLGAFAIRQLEELSFRLAVVARGGVGIRRSNRRRLRRVRRRNSRRHEACRQNDRQRRYEGTGHVSRRRAAE